MVGKIFQKLISCLGRFLGTEVLSYRPLSYEKSCTLGRRIIDPPLQYVNFSKFFQPLSPTYSYLDSPSPFIVFSNFYKDEICVSRRYVINCVTIITKGRRLYPLCHANRLMDDKLLTHPPSLLIVHCHRRDKTFI